MLSHSGSFDDPLEVTVELFVLGVDEGIGDMTDRSERRSDFGVDFSVVAGIGG